MADSYKFSHWLQLPEGVSSSYSYIESRGGRWKETLFFGLQMFLKEYLSKPITKEMVDEAEEFILAHGEPFNRAGWDYIVNNLGGKLPIEIKAVREGTVVPTGNILVSITNTDDKCYWLPSFLETMLLRSVWYPTTVATNSYECKKIILRYLELSGDPATIAFKLHDFGGRGVSSSESAAIGGCAHLVNFMGSDTVEGILAAKKYYNEPMAAFSIPAAEHQTITSWGKENEAEAYRNMLRQFAKPESLVAVVSDSYDIYNACRNIWGDKLKQEVIDTGATIVVRPDSGNPVEVSLKCVELLAEGYGYTVNEKGYKVLPSCIRVIYGDGINETSIENILSNLTKNGWSADNIGFGMGGALLQQIDRDTLKFAMKCSSITINGKEMDVFKDPITDSGKKSKKGRLSLIKENGNYKTVPECENDELIVVYRNGVLLNEQSLAEIRARA